MKILIKIFLVLLFVNLSFAQRAELNHFIMDYGQTFDFVSARSLGMGGSGLAGGQSYDAPAINPALLSRTSGVIAVAAGMWLNKTVEDRAFPYYDSFVGFNDYGSYAYNAYWKQNGWVSVQYRIPASLVRGLTVATGYVPFRSYEYDYREEVRDPVNKNDRLLGYNTMMQTGRLNAIPLAVSYRIFNSLSVGAQVSFLLGNLEYKEMVNPKASEFQKNARNLKIRKQLAATPLVADLGATYTVNPRLTVGAKVRLPYTVKFNRQFSDLLADSSASLPAQQLDYPLTLGAGFEYRFENVLAAVINFDFNYRFWSQFKVDGQTPQSFNDSYQIKLGVEHRFFDRVPLRAGFLYETLPQSASFTRSVMTVGSGFVFRNVHVNMSGGVSNFKYYQDDLFPEDLYGLENRSDADRVRVTDFFVRLDCNYALQFSGK